MKCDKIETLIKVSGTKRYLLWNKEKKQQQKNIKVFFQI